MDYIGEFAFAFCKSLKEFPIPSSVTFIGTTAFYGCPLNISPRQKIRDNNEQKISDNDEQGITHLCLIE